MLTTYPPLLSRAASSMAEPTPGVAVADWDDLFCAVKARLKLTVDEWVAAGTEPDLRDAENRVREGVLQCSEALDQLHATLAHEAARRRLLHERLHHALARAGPQMKSVAVPYLDLDGVQPVNDAHRHYTGDELLRIVAARLTRAVRSDDFVGSLGGDEFACLLANLPSRERLSHLACSLLDAVAAPLKIGALELTLPPSIGSATYPAGAAMYLAKRRRTGLAFFDERAEFAASAGVPSG
jgi:diguanylate cyclase